MRKILLILAAVALVGCGESKEEKAAKAAADWKVIEAAIRETFKTLNKPRLPRQLTKADLEKVTVVLLNFKKLTEVPKGLEKLTQLTYLNLAGNQLTDVKGLENLTQLKVLALGANKLTEVPKGLENLTQLTELWISINQLTSVKGLEKLTKLTKVNLDRNQLTDVKGLEKLTQLANLNLKDNPDLTKAQIAELQKALPKKCKIESNPTK